MASFESCETASKSNREISLPANIERVDPVDCSAIFAISE